MKKSIRYKLFHEPHTVSDFVDLLSKVDASEIEVTTRREEIIHNPYILTQFIADLKVVGEEDTREVEVICGGYLHNYSTARKISAHNEANSELKDAIEKLRSLDVVVPDEVKSFQLPEDVKAEEPSPYAKFLKSQLILRDELAIDRTVLANERTLLAYLRTGLALVITGAGLVKFFNDVSAGIALMVAAAAIGVWGVIRFRAVGNDVKTVREAEQEFSEFLQFDKCRVVPKDGSADAVSLKTAEQTQ